MGLTSLSGLFGRDFVVAYMMPSVLLFFGALVDLAIFEIVPISYQWLADETLTGLSVTIIGVWLFGIVLFLLNYHVVRLFEGYWLINWLWLPKQLQVWKFRRLVRRRQVVARIWREHRARGEAIPEDLKKQWAQIKGDLANLYPREEKDLLPTKLGNAIRAFERYPGIMYGLESIDGWFRLLGVVDDAYREMLGSAKAALDFWLNTCVVFVILTAGFFGASTYAGEVVYIFGEAYWRGAIGNPWLLLVPLATLVLAALSYLAAVSAAVAWGGFVKGAFDLYINDLAAKVGIELPLDLDGRRELWQQFSKAIAYRNPKNLARVHALRLMRG